MLSLLVHNVVGAAVIASANVVTPTRISAPAHQFTVGGTSFSLSEGLGKVGNAFGTDTTGFKQAEGLKPVPLRSPHARCTI